MPNKVNDSEMRPLLMQLQKQKLWQNYNCKVFWYAAIKVWSEGEKHVLIGNSCLLIVLVGLMGPVA